MSEQAVANTELDRYECRACGYVYEPQKGDDKHDIAPGTSFAELPNSWKCPVCSAKKVAFTNIGPEVLHRASKKILSMAWVSIP